MAIVENLPTEKPSSFKVIARKLAAQDPPSLLSAARACEALPRVTAEGVEI